MRDDAVLLREVAAAAEAIILACEGRKILRPGLKESPTRVAKAFLEYTSGYDQDPIDVLKTFEDGAEGSAGQIVLVGGLRVSSLCEHHLAPFTGRAYIGYIPRSRIVGLSKFQRLVDIYARRFQVQERLTNLIADAIKEVVEPAAVGVVVVCTHGCMSHRGVKIHDSNTVTSALRGDFMNEPAARAEFFNAVSLSQNTEVN